MLAEVAEYCTVRYIYVGTAHFPRIITLRGCARPRTRYVETILNQCWAAVVDIQPALVQHVVFAE